MKRALVNIMVAIHLLDREVLCRVPLARHRDVVTTQGTVRGYYSPHPPHYAFLGIPYARPPTYYDRFKAPEPPSNWDGVFEGTHRVKCPQPDGTGDENCLVVNVFTKEGADSLPVLIYFHGGGFQTGWGFHYAPIRLIRQDLILVTFNYRLGALGFLSLNTPDIPGNAGLKDQVAALYWVQRNIARFGGNPSDVTAYGTGSGAASIQLLILSDLVTNLFHKAILESGSALSPSSIVQNAKSIAISVAKSLGYMGDEDLANLEEFYYTSQVEMLTNLSRIFLPCVDKYSKLSLLDKDPWEVIQSGKYHHIPMFVTVTTAEEVTVILENKEKYNDTPDDFDNFLPNNLAFEDDNTAHAIAKTIKDFYFADTDQTIGVIQNYADYVNDVFLQYPIVKSTVYHAFKNNLPVFLMKFQYEGSLRKMFFKDMKGSGYDDILRYITSDENLDEIDELIAYRLITLWINFIKLGDPTPLTTSLIPVIWQPVVPKQIDSKPSLSTIQYMRVGKTMVNDELYSPHLIFWDRIYSKFYKYNKN